MGEQAEDIFSSFGLSETEQDDFDIVLKKFNDHFVVKKNTIFERAQFNKRVQLDGESVNAFITALYTLSERCEYGVLHDELIRDRIVADIRDKNLSEKLKLDADLTLTKVIERVRLSEVVKEQQEKLIEKDSASVNAISPNKPAKFLKQKPSSGARKQNVKPDFHRKNNENESRLHGKCKWCGKQRHDKRVCPARNARCRRCSKIGHYAKVCITKSQTGCSEVAYLGVVQLESKNKTNIDWTVTVQVNHKKIKFKIDSGADHTVLPANVFQNVFQNAKLEPPLNKILCGPDRNPLKTLGKFKTNIEYKGKSCTEEIYVISNLQTCLLGKPALFSLGLGPNLNSICQISVADSKAKFPELFKGLGICADSSFKAELKRMVEEKVITPVLKPTEWCAPVVIVPKSDGNVRICVDLIELNTNAMRELHPLPKAEYSLNLLTGAKIFSKLDANSGFWQILLDKKSSYLTTFITPFGRLRFQRLPFGISSAPEHFQRRMSQMLEGIPGTICHMDDILIWGSTQEEHDQRLTEVCKKLKNSGKELFAADALSRNPQKVPYKREELEAEIDAFIQMITSSLPASSRRLDELRVAQLKEETCQKLTDYVLKGWPSKKEVDTLCAPYWQNCYEISVQDGLLMRGCRIIIPQSHQAEVLNQIHEGNVGITKCRARARCSVYWPGISKVIEEKIKSCTACIQESSNHHQPLIPTSFPERPWEVLGLDLFKYKNSWYLLISDYYSRYPEIARLDRLTSAEVINHCKSIFSRHGIPDVVRSDNGSQFDPVKTVEFKDFAKSYGLTHISSSPKFSQSSGLIEAAVKTVKDRIKKSRDPYLALMAYRATPLENGFSPSELLMGRRINTTLPVAKTQLQPYSMNKKVLKAKEERRIEGQKMNYDKHHGVRNLDELDPGQNVWITDRRVTGKVLQKTPYPRSYLVQSGRRVYRRNRKHLIPSLDFHPEHEPEDDSDVTGYQHSPTDADPGCPLLKSSPQSPKTYPERASSSTEASPDPYVTRSGRTVRPPERLDL
ncbi:Uncharacterized protein K02A2.6 [Araneus ventricosus]|uniref:RNA-directed DNA polymerase n=1 Tax=Araneus ventricosus TaxID=182803 RepID=A0A4Y2ATY5_ARAVE|nr:Uncharacterized protein K02A2.6 [Araneus ventricosus]